MSTCLDDPRAAALLNCDPGELETLSTQFHTVAGQAHTAATGLQGADGDATWTGTAADRFRSQLGKLPGDLHNVHTSYSGTATALRNYGTQLEPVQREFTTLSGQLQSAQSNLSSAQGQLRTAKTNLTNATSAPHADPRSSAVTSAHGAVSTASTDVGNYGDEVDRLDRRGHDLLDEFDRLRRTAITLIDQASGVAPVHHSSLWGSICHIADDVGHIAVSVGKFVGHAVVGIVEKIKDLPSAAWDLATHPSWKNLGRFCTDVAVTASVVAMVVAPFAAPELAEADAVVDGGEAALDTVEGGADAAEGGAEAASTGGRFASAVSKGKEVVGKGRVGARYINHAGARVSTVGGLGNVYADVGQGHYKAAFIDAAFIAAPQGREFPKTIGDFKTAGDRVADTLGVGEGSARNAAEMASNAKRYQQLRAMGSTDGQARSIVGDNLPRSLGHNPSIDQMDNAAKSTAANAAKMPGRAIHIGSPVAIITDRVVLDPLLDKYKERVGAVPEPAGAEG